MLATGFPQADAENDFLRARRRQFLAALANRLRGRPADSGRLVPLDEIVGSLGWRGQRQLGLQTIRLDTIVGTAGARRDFDRCFRPAAGRVRSRWERLALAQRRGAAVPPIEVYRVGHRHFVSDGHHRVSIAAATGQQLIDAYVTQVLTTVPPPAQAARPPRCWRLAGRRLIGRGTVSRQRRRYPAPRGSRGRVRRTARARPRHR
jgi:hypothetical protein